MQKPAAAEKGCGLERSAKRSFQSLCAETEKGKNSQKQNEQVQVSSNLSSPSLNLERRGGRPQRRGSVRSGRRRGRRQSIKKDFGQSVVGDRSSHSRLLLRAYSFVRFYHVESNHEDKKSKETHATDESNHEDKKSKGHRDDDNQSPAIYTNVATRKAQDDFGDED